MGKKVLIIEDKAGEATLVKILLKEAGLESEIANNGNTGLVKALELKPDLITLDLGLPDMDGFELCQRLKKEPSLSHTIIVVLSVIDDLEDIKKALKAGADDYIIKMPLPEFMARKIKLYLGMK
ncbi:MAG: response regulator [Candidatus Omnitrophica bacterium]|nr:response regulator [Candidatus Omnitrophota bacterium]